MCRANQIVLVLSCMFSCCCARSQSGVHASLNVDNVYTYAYRTLYPNLEMGFEGVVTIHSSLGLALGVSYVRTSFDQIALTHTEPRVIRIKTNFNQLNLFTGGSIALGQSGSNLSVGILSRYIFSASAHSRDRRYGVNGVNNNYAGATQSWYHLLAWAGKYFFSGENRLYLRGSFYVGLPELPWTQASLLQGLNLGIGYRIR